MSLDDQLQWYRDNLPLPGAVVADVGANIGRLSAGFLAGGDGRTRVVSIEPLPDNLVRLRQLAGDEPRWSIEAYAVSDHDGTVLLRREHDDEHGFNAVVWDGKTGPDTLEVSARTLPVLVPDATVVKLDIEGHEFVVLDHALPRMPGVQAWTVEVHMVPGYPLSPMLAAFVEHGYRIVAATTRPGDASGAWVSSPVPVSLSWDQIPVAKVRGDGSVFKMLHMMALRE